MKHLPLVAVILANLFIGVGLYNDYNEPEVAHLEVEHVQALEAQEITEPAPTEQPLPEVTEQTPTTPQEPQQAVTWQSNPNNCNEHQWIAKEAPYSCIDKPKPVASKPAVTAQQVSGDKQSWLRASGIPESDWQYADYIVTKESSWNPKAVNPNGGACGLVQALPCSKLGANWSDPVTALKWQYNYVNSRYGGYYQAYQFWLSNKWY